MHRRSYLRKLAALAVTSGVAGCSESEPAATTAEATGTATPTASPTPMPTRTPGPTPGDRSLRPYRSWLVAPTPVSPHTYQFTHLSLSAVRADATGTFADQLDTYWHQRTEAYFGVQVPVDDIDTALTVNHSRLANESYRVAGGSFDTDALRTALADAGFERDGYADDIQRFARTENGRLRVVGLHPDVLISIGAEPTATDPLTAAVEQHDASDVRGENDDALASLIDHFGEADYVTGRELEPIEGDYPLSTAVATGRRLDVRETTTWAERSYVLTPTSTADRAAIEEEIRTRHVGQPIAEYRRDGRIVTVGGEVENSLVRLV